MWFHRPLRADEWLLYHQKSPSAQGARGLAEGFIYRHDGALAVTVMQEGLIRPLHHAMSVTSSCVPTRSRRRRRRCGGRWPTPRSATTSTARTRRSTACSRSRRPRSGPRPRSTRRRARWRTSSRLRVLSRPGTEVLCPARCARVPLRGRGLAAEQRRAAPPVVGRARRHRRRGRRDGATSSRRCRCSCSRTPTWRCRARRPAPRRCARSSASRTNGGLRVHVDGARIWNAAIATGSPPSELTGGADTVMFCLSKGLSAPVGSVLCGPADVIAEARAQRRRLGRRDAPGRRDRGGGYRRARDDGRAARRRPRARARARRRAAPSAGRAASIPQTVQHQHRLRAARRAARPVRRAARRGGRARPARSIRARSGS